jgi:hypothetical protein
MSYTSIAEDDGFAAQRDSIREKRRRQDDVAFRALDVCADERAQRRARISIHVREGLVKEECSRLYDEGSGNC